MSDLIIKKNGTKLRDNVNVKQTQNLEIVRELITNEELGVISRLTAVNFKNDYFQQFYNIQSWFKHEMISCVFALLSHKTKLIET